MGLSALPWVQIDRKNLELILQPWNDKTTTLPIQPQSPQSNVFSFQNGQF